MVLDIKNNFISKSKPIFNVGFNVADKNVLPDYIGNFTECLTNIKITQ